MRQCSCLNLPAADGAAFRSTELDGEFIHIVDARSELDNHTKRQYSDRLERHVKRRLSALEEQAAHALRRARRLPVGAERNDLRQLAMGLLWLHRNGMDALVKQRSAFAVHEGVAETDHAEQRGLKSACVRYFPRSPT